MRPTAPVSGHAALLSISAFSWAGLQYRTAADAGNGQIRHPANGRPSGFTGGEAGILWRAYG